MKTFLKHKNLILFMVCLLLFSLCLSKSNETTEEVVEIIQEEIIN